MDRIRNLKFRFRREDKINNNSSTRIHDEHGLAVSPWKGSVVVKAAMVAPARAVEESEEKLGIVKSMDRVGSEREDVCFVCLDGENGMIVGCGHRDCPKAYHLSCVGLDEKVLNNAVRWNCAWHVCKKCDKTAKYMCYTCVYSLCTECIENFTFFSVRKSKGFCEQCIDMVMMIEDEKQSGILRKSGCDFNDEFSWEFHFKDYWVGLKNKLSLTLNELRQAMGLSHNKVSAAEYVSSDRPLADIETRNSRRSNTERWLESSPKDGSAEVLHITNVGGRSSQNSTIWASKELLEFVAYVKNGDTSFLSEFDARAVLLEYIARNKLRDPCQRSNIVCDSRLQKLFGRAYVKHFEMLRLFDSHLLIKEDDQAAEANIRTNGDQEMQEAQPNYQIMDQGCDEPKLDDKNLEKPVILGGTGSSTKKRKQINPKRRRSTVDSNFSDAPNGPIAATRQSEQMAGKDCLGNGCRIDSSGKMCGYLPNQESNSNPNSSPKLKNCTVASEADTLAGNIQASVRIAESAEASPSVDLEQSSNEERTTKMWYYQDPKGKTQGPFSMQQLDKWSRSSQFPANLKIWKTVEDRNVLMLLIDALNGKLC